MAANEIKADYEQLAQAANRFDVQGQQIQQIAQSVQRSMEMLRSGWEGRGSQAFFNEMQGNVLPAVNRLHQGMAQAARVTRQISQVLRQAESEAAQPFRHRDASGMTLPTATTVLDQDGGAGGSARGLPLGLTKKWAKLTDAERMQALQAMANEIAANHGLRNLPVSVEQLSDSLGLNSLGNWDGSKIRIDIDDLKDPDAAINTLAHEARHAVQQHMGNQATPGFWQRILRFVGLEPKPAWPQHGISEDLAKTWDNNFANYHSAPTKYDPNDPESVKQMNDYLNQSIEKDARAYGDSFVQGMNSEKLQGYVPKPAPKAEPKPTPDPDGPPAAVPVPGKPPKATPTLSRDV